MEDLEQISVKTRLSFFLLFKVTPGNEHVIPAISPKPRESNTHAKSEAVSERERERGGEMEEEIKAEFRKSGFALDEEEEILRKCKFVPLHASNPIKVSNL